MVTTQKTQTLRCFKLKADLTPITTLQIERLDLPLIAQQIDELRIQAPYFFDHTPIIIDLSHFTDHSLIDINGLIKLLRDRNAIPVGVKGVEKKDQPRFKEAGLAVFQRSRTQSSKNTPTKEHATARRTEIITQPVRAGSKIYAEKADLIVLSSINSGAECIADGHIHVYGPLRGRVLAGAQGDTSARIFCRQLEAELVAIAGRYWVSEEIPSLNEEKNKPMDLKHIFLEKNDKLNIDFI